MKKFSIILIALFTLVLAISPKPALGTSPSEYQLHTADPQANQQTSQLPGSRRINIPYFSDEIEFSEMAILWFGQVTPTINYSDIRVGYNNTEIYLQFEIFDRQLWYDTSPSISDLKSWDTATLYLDKDGNSGNSPDQSSYQFIGQLSWDDAGWSNDRLNYQAVYQGNGSGWNLTSIPFKSSPGWRGPLNNSNEDARGWAMNFEIPFSSLGLSGPPADGTVWGLGLELNDRDDSQGSSIPAQTWPENTNFLQPNTWGQLHFGLPTYTPEPATPAETITIQHKLNGATVPDAAVGGSIGNLCPGDEDYIWSGWGNENYAGAADFNIQNQSDVSDWPCFAKYYLTFPLDNLPAGKVILSASVTLHQSGGSGDPGEASPSLIQISLVNENWSEASLTWNNAPLAHENVSQAWADPVTGCGSTVPWPCFPRTWDVSRGTAMAYAAGTPLRLAFYEADSDYHSGKHFTSSDTGDWNAEGRPTLVIQLGDPSLVSTLEKSANRVTATQGSLINYALNWTGTGEAQSLTDQLPSGLSAPSNLQASTGNVSYSSHQIDWSGTPGQGEVVNITYQTTVLATGPVVLVNDASLSENGNPISSDHFSLFVDPLQVFLPLISR